MKSHQSISFFRVFTNHSCFFMKILKMDHLKQIEISRNSRPKKVSISQDWIHSWDTNFFEIYVWLISSFEAHITNLQKASERLFNTALLQILFAERLKLFRTFRESFPYRWICLHVFFFKWQFRCFETCYTIQHWKVYLNLFWSVASPKIGQQLLSFSKFSLKPYQVYTEKLYIATIFLYAISDTR